MRSKVALIAFDWRMYGMSEILGSIELSIVMRWIGMKVWYIKPSADGLTMQDDVKDCLSIGR